MDLHSPIGLHDVHGQDFKNKSILFYPQFFFPSQTLLDNELLWQLKEKFLVLIIIKPLSIQHVASNFIELSWTYHLLMRTGSCSLAIVLNFRTNTSNILMSSSRPCPFSSSLRALMHSTRLSSSLHDMVWILQHVISLPLPPGSIHCSWHLLFRLHSLQL